MPDQPVSGIILGPLRHVGWLHKSAYGGVETSKVQQLWLGAQSKRRVFAIVGSVVAYGASLQTLLVDGGIDTAAAIDVWDLSQGSPTLTFPPDAGPRSFVVTKPRHVKRLSVNDERDRPYLLVAETDDEYATWCGAFSWALYALRELAVPRVLRAKASADIALSVTSEGTTWTLSWIVALRAAPGVWPVPALEELPVWGFLGPQLCGAPARCTISSSGLVLRAVDGHSLRLGVMRESDACAWHTAAVDGWCYPGFDVVPTPVGTVVVALDSAGGPMGVLSSSTASRAAPVAAICRRSACNADSLEDVAAELHGQGTLITVPTGTAAQSSLPAPLSVVVVGCVGSGAPELCVVLDGAIDPRTPSARDVAEPVSEVVLPWVVDDTLSVDLRVVCAGGSSSEAVLKVMCRGADAVVCVFDTTDQFSLQWVEQRMAAFGIIASRVVTVGLNGASDRRSVSQLRVNALTFAHRAHVFAGAAATVPAAALLDAVQGRLQRAIGVELLAASGWSLDGARRAVASWETSDDADPIPALPPAVACGMGADVARLGRLPSQASPFVKALRVVRCLGALTAADPRGVIAATDRGASANRVVDTLNAALRRIVRHPTRAFSATSRVSLVHVASLFDAANVSFTTEAARTLCTRSSNAPPPRDTDVATIDALVRDASREAWHLHDPCVALATCVALRRIAAADPVAYLTNVTSTADEVAEAERHAQQASTQLCCRCRAGFNAARAAAECHVCQRRFCSSCIDADGICLECRGDVRTPRVALWVPDAAVSSCASCAAAFSLLKRRHHCRACGDVVCSDCSPYTMAVEGYTGSQRVCASCWEERHASPGDEPLSPNEALSPGVRSPLAVTPPVGTPPASTPTTANALHLVAPPAAAVAVDPLAVLAPWKDLKQDPAFELPWYDDYSSEDERELLAQPIPPRDPVAPRVSYVVLMPGVDLTDS